MWFHRFHRLTKGPELPVVPDHGQQEMDAGPCLPLQVADLDLHMERALAAATMQVNLRRLIRLLRTRSQLLVPHPSLGIHVQGRFLPRGGHLPRRHPVVLNLKPPGPCLNPDLDEEAWDLCLQRCTAPMIILV